MGFMKPRDTRIVRVVAYAHLWMDIRIYDPSLEYTRRCRLFWVAAVALVISVFCMRWRTETKVKAH